MIRILSFFFFFEADIVFEDVWCPNDTVFESRGKGEGWHVLLVDFDQAELPSTLNTTGEIDSADDGAPAIEANKGRNPDVLEN